MTSSLEAEAIAKAEGEKVLKSVTSALKAADDTKVTYRPFTMEQLQLCQESTIDIKSVDVTEAFVTQDFPEARL